MDKNSLAPWPMLLHPRAFQLRAPQSADRRSGLIRPEVVLRKRKARELLPVRSKLLTKECKVCHLARRGVTVEPEIKQKVLKISKVQ